MRIYDPKKVLAAVDFSDLSRGVLKVAAEIGENRNAEVMAIHVARNPDYGAKYGGYGAELVGTISPSRLLEDSRVELQSNLDVMVKQVESSVTHRDPGRFRRADEGDRAIRRDGEFRPSRHGHARPQHGEPLFDRERLRAGAQARALSGVSVEGQGGPAEDGGTRGGGGERELENGFRPPSPVRRRAPGRAFFCLLPLAVAF